MSGARLALALCLGACLPDSLPERGLVLPDLRPDAAESLIIVAITNGEPRIAYASRAGDLHAAAPAVDAESEVFALLYECDLEVLELAPGRLMLAGAGSDVGRPLPEPLKLLKQGSSAPGDWGAVSQAPQEILSVRIVEPTRSSPCATFSSTDYPTPLTPGVSLVVPWADGGFLASRVARRGEEVEFVQFTRTSSAVLARYPFGTPQTAGFLDRDGVLWVLGAGGGLSKARIPEPFTFVAQSQLHGAVFGWLDGPRDESELFELFGVLDGGGLSRFHDGVWDVIRPFGRSLSFGGGVVRLGPEKAVAVGPDGGKLSVYDAGLTSLQTMPGVSGQDRPIAITRVPHFGVVAISGLGAIAFDSGTGWQPLEAAGVAAQGVARYGSGFVVGRPETPGALQQYLPWRSCPPQVVTPDEVQQIFSVGRALAVISKKEFSGVGPWVSYVEGQGGYPSCPGRGTLYDVPN